MDEYPIAGDDDIKFIKKTIAERVNAGTKAAAEKEREARDIAKGGSNWVGKYPMHRLIHALVDHDEIKRAFLMRHNLPNGRMTVEN